MYKKLLFMGEIWAGNTLIFSIGCFDNVNYNVM